MDVEESVVSDLARRMVDQAAPEERPIFRAMSRDYFATRKHSSRLDCDHSRPLRFGTGEVILLITPVALAAAKTILQHAVDTLVDSVVERGVANTSTVLRRLFGIGSTGNGVVDEDEPPALTAEQWHQVHQLVIQTALESGLPEEKARLMAAAVVGQGHLLCEER